MKNEPLDWMEIEQKIGEIMAKEKFPYCNVSVKARQEIMYVLLKKLVPFIKQRIKSACEFYLRYKDNPILFWKEQEKYKKQFKKKFGNVVIAGEEMRPFNDWKNQYNKWLFKLAFKDIFKEEENESKM
ncbi:MAG: hypothetical protein DRJ34_01520 [Thermoprotei archaeon]|nr:MAG: hypothetical protein DRJ34_01520 [Thermoprotei archaeon]